MSLAELLDLLGRDFMQRALLAALLTGLAAPAIGTFLVQRRLALLGDGIGHVAVTGVALGLLTGTSPTWTAVVVAILGAVLIEVIREQGHANGDVALALLFYGGLAGGVLITGLAGEGAASLQVYLFGSVTSISARPRSGHRRAGRGRPDDHAGAAPQLFAVASATRSSRGSPGCSVRFYNLLVAVLAAVSVTVAMRTVGLLLVSALMVVPVATSQQLTRSFRATLLAAMVIGGVAAVGGLVVSAWLSARASVAPGPDDRAARARDASPRPGRWACGCGAAARLLRAVPDASRHGSPARGAGHDRRAPARARRRLRPPRRPARRPRRLRPRRPPARRPRRALDEH